MCQIEVAKRQTSVPVQWMFIWEAFVTASRREHDDRNRCVWSFIIFVFYKLRAGVRLAWLVSGIKSVVVWMDGGGGRHTSRFSLCSTAWLGLVFCYIPPLMS